MSLILGAALLSGVFAQGAVANVITVKVTAHVVGWSDSYGTLGGQINVGQVITGTYTYDTGTPVQSQIPAQYLPTSPPANITISAGAFTFQSLSTSQFQISVVPGKGTSSPGMLRIESWNNKPLTGVPYPDVNDIQFTFMDPSGQWPTSSALPTGAPTLQNLSASQSQILISGTYFNVQAQIDSVALSPLTLEVSPASGSFAAGQHFDIALLLPAGTQVASMLGTVSGNPTPQFNYPGPGPCVLGPQNSAGRPVILCPNGNAFLATLGSGVSRVNFQVTLVDGTILYQNVAWNLVQ
jgi:hypothetical protein